MSALQQMLFSEKIASGSRVVINLTISANTKNYNIFSNKGGTYSAGLSDITLTINSGIIVGSTSTSTYGLDTGTGWTTGDTITIVNNGYIVGKGGAGSTPTAGGPALHVQYATSINNGSGYIYSGGGGGAQGQIGTVYSGYGGGGGGGQGVDSQGYSLVTFSSGSTRVYGGHAG